MTWIVDASVAAKWYLAETGSDLAQKLFDSGEDLIAPDLLLVELSNTLFKAWLRGAIDDAHMDMSLAQVPRAIRQFVPLAELVADAQVIARILRHPVYDCVYLALAWKTGARVVTADERFVASARAMSWENFLVFLPHAVQP